MMKKIVTEKAPGAIGPYCQGVVHGDLVIDLSGYRRGGSLFGLRFP